MQIVLRKIFYTIFLWVIFFTSINVICGFIVKNRYIAVDPIDSKLAETSWGYLKPDQDKIILFPGVDEYKVKINAMGFRSVGVNDEKFLQDFDDTYKILAVGDSMTFGLFVDDKDSYPFQLQKILFENNKNAAVFNAGLGSSTAPDYLYYLNKKGLALKPDLVLLNFYNNDLAELKGWKTPVYEKVIDENIFSIADTIKLAKFMRIFRKWELAYRYRRSTRKIKDERIKQILFDQSKKIEDVLYVAEFNRKEILSDPNQDSLKSLWRKYFENLDSIIELLDNENIDFIYIIYPDIYTVFDKGDNGNYQEILKEYLDENEVEYIDLRPIFHERKDNYLSLYNNLPRDYHLSGKGKKILSDELFRRVKSRIK